MYVVDMGREIFIHESNRVQETPTQIEFRFGQDIGLG